MGHAFYSLWGLDKLDEYFSGECGTGRWNVDVIRLDQHIASVQPCYDVSDRNYGKYLIRVYLPRVASGARIVVCKSTILRSSLHVTHRSGVIFHHVIWPVSSSKAVSSYDKKVITNLTIAFPNISRPMLELRSPSAAVWIGTQNLRAVMPNLWMRE
jgi:hypothetical protein